MSGAKREEGVSLLASTGGSAWSQLIERVRQGDEPAFDEFVKAFWDTLMRFFWKRIAAEDAEELTQNVFVSVYRNILRGGGPKGSDWDDWRRYVLAAARNQLVDFVRHENARPSLGELDSMFPDDLSWQDRVGSIHAAPDVSGFLLSREQREGIRDCMGRLAVQLRVVCWLHFVDGKPKREIARITARPESSVRVLMVEALKNLRRCLELKGLAPAC